MKNAKKPSIVVVDDDEAVLQVIVLLLEDEGFDVYATTLPVEAETLIQTAQPDVIILDLVMPDISGRELYARIKQHRDLSHIPIILVSAFHNVESVAEDLHAENYLHKPFDPDTLIETVASAAAKRVG